MKRIITLLLMLTTIIFVNAQSFTVNGINYNVLNPTEVEVIALPSEKYQGDIAIPEFVVNNNTTYDVVAVGDNAFNFCLELNSIDLSNTIKNIGSYSFQSCWSLKTIKLSNTLESINNNAFASCIALSSIVFPQSLTSIGSNAFQECSGLTFLDLPMKINNIESGCFASCEGLKSLVLHEGLENIGEGAFYGCSNLISIELPESLKTLESNAFGYCVSLTNITVMNIDPLIINSDVFILTPISSIKLIVPLESEIIYKEADVWEDFFEISENDTAENNITLFFNKINFINDFKFHFVDNKIIIETKEKYIINNLELINIKGDVISANNSNQIDVSSVETGVYFLKVATSQGVFTRKIYK